MELAALIIAFASMAGTVAAAVFAGFARIDAINAGEEAKRAAERAATATERMAQIQSRIFDGPPWEVTWYGGDTFLLTNNSPVDAHNVTLEFVPEDIASSVTLDSELPWNVGAKSARKFMFAPHLGMGMQKDIRVLWRRDGSDVIESWQHPIPARSR